MIEIKRIGVWGFEGAIRGMRMPYESFDKSDSVGCDGCDFFDVDKYSCTQHGMVCPWGKWLIGENDMALCKKLIEAGSEHRKFLRMIHVQADIRAPRYWWQEARTYKFFRANPDDLEMNSSSTMHLITKRELTDNDFSFDYGDNKLPDEYMRRAIDNLNDAIREYQKDKEEKSDKYTLDRDFRTIKQILPEGFMQKAIVDTNYECLLNIYHQRYSHRLTEWKTVCAWMLTLPYFKTFVDMMEKRF